MPQWLTQTRLSLKLRILAITVAQVDNLGWPKLEPSSPAIRLHLLVTAEQQVSLLRGSYGEIGLFQFG